MQAQQIITDIRNELVEPVPGFWTDTELLRNINRAEIDFNNKTRILESFAFMQTTVGVNKYPLPANCLSIRAVLFNEPSETTSNWFRVTPTNLEKIMQERPDFLDTTEFNQGTPRRYWIWQRNLYLFPAPDTSTPANLYLFYKAKPTPLTQVTDQINIDDSLAEAINCFVLWKAWAKEQEDDKSAMKKAEYMTYIGEGRRWVKRESGDQKFRVDIESPVPFSNAGLGGVGGLSGGFNPFIPF